MNPFDKVANFFGYQRKKPSGFRQFQAAQISRLTSDWKPLTNSIDQDIFRDLVALRGRSRALSVNNDYIKEYLRLLKINVVGPNGITLQNQAKDPGGKLDQNANEAIEAAFRAWGKAGNCDVTGKLSWIDIQNQFLEATAKDGEVLIRKVKNFDNPFRFALQIIEADHLDHNLNRDLGNGRVIRMGVELDEWRRPVAYWIRKHHPGDSLYSYASTEHQPERIPASEIIHRFDILRVNQTRGVPWAHAAMFRLNQLGAYEDAELVAARAGACKMGFVEQGEDSQGYTGEERDADGNIIENFEPGLIEVLQQGQKFVSHDPTHPSGNFDPFIKAILRGVASGLGVSYVSLANDLEGVNFSSIRSGVLQERDCYMVIQNWVIQHLCESIFSDWLEMAMLSGQIKLPFVKFDKFNQPTWQGRRWPWVDPLKDAQANLLAVRMGAKDLTDVIRDTGRDPDDVFTQISNTKKTLKELDLGEVFDFIFSPKGNTNASGIESKKD